MARSIMKSKDLQWMRKEMLFWQSEVSPFCGIQIVKSMSNSKKYVMI